MDYEDIYNCFEAGEQNVNARNGRARSQAHQRFKYIYFAEKRIFSESSFIGKISKKILHTAPHSKGTIPF